MTLAIVILLRIDHERRIADTQTDNEQSIGELDKEAKEISEELLEQVDEFKNKRIEQ